MKHTVSAWQSTDGAPLRPYVSLLETARLYAGWLLAWYAAIFLLAGQHALGRLSLQWEWIDALARSPLVLRFAFATFAFLLLSSLHRTLHGNTILGLLLSVAWLLATIAFAAMS